MNKGDIDKLEKGQTMKLTFKPEFGSRTLEGTFSEVIKGEKDSVDQVVLDDGNIKIDEDVIESLEVEA